MKRLLLCLIITIYVALLFGCGEQQEATATPQTAQMTATPSKAPTLPIIALVLAKDTPFNNAFEEKAKTAAEKMGYNLLSYYCTSPSNQVDNIYSAIGEGTKAIIIEPLDMDNLQVVLEECDSQKIPVINALVPINGIVKMLISPDFTQIGKTVAQNVSKWGDNINILSVEEKSAAFVNQLVHDGLQKGADEYKNVRIAHAIITEDEEESAYNAILQKLKEEDINAIFAYTEAIAKGAVKAVEESGKEINIIAFGASADIIGLIQSGKIKEGVFISPNQIADLAVKNAIEAVNGLNIPQFANLNTQTITSANAQNYAKFGSYGDLL